MAGGGQFLVRFGHTPIPLADWLISLPAARCRLLLAATEWIFIIKSCTSLLPLIVHRVFTMTTSASVCKPCSVVVKKLPCKPFSVVVKKLPMFLKDLRNASELKSFGKLGNIFRCPSCTDPQASPEQLLKHVRNHGRDKSYREKRYWRWLRILVEHIQRPSSTIDAVHRAINIVCPLCPFAGNRFLKHFQRKHKRISDRQRLMLSVLLSK